MALEAAAVTEACGTAIARGRRRPRGRPGSARPTSNASPMPAARRPIVALSVEDLGEKEAVLAAARRGLHDPALRRLCAVLVQTGAWKKRDARRNPRRLAGGGAIEAGSGVPEQRPLR